MLCALAQGAGHGADLAARIYGCSMGIVRVPDASLYPTIRALISEGLACEVRTDKRRKVIALTPMGISAANDVLAVLSLLARAHSEEP